MASPVLHIKDSYYFEVPKFMWPSTYDGLEGPSQFPDFWIKLDPDYLLWEGERLYGRLVQQEDAAFGDLPVWEDVAGKYMAWTHDHENAGKPLADFLKQQPWFADGKPDAAKLQKLSELQDSVRNVKEYRASHEWTDTKISGYNQVLSGKILIPQPFGGARKNLYEAESGFCISKYMVVQVVVALLIGWLFIAMARRLSNGEPPKGRLWNMLEAILLFLRDEVARPAIGKHDADRFVPLLWTIFLFVLGCNLMGMVPWVGAPTSAFGVTMALAVVTFGTGIAMGSAKFGIIGYWKNQVPSMDLPWVLKILLVPMIWAIEVLGLFIKHAVLGIRLLANMVAGHLVLLAIMGLAFSIEGAMSSTWGITAVISVLGSTIFSCLELFVAFLQAYIFTFLSALFIGAAVHHH